MADPAPLPLHRLAEVVAGYAWAATRLFEVLGQAATRSPEPAAAAWMATTSRRFAAHAELWGSLLPVAPALAAHRELRAPDPSWDALLSAVGSAATTQEVLAGVVRAALPRLVVAHDAHLQRTAPFTDAPVIRALTVVLDDEITAWRGGEAVLHRLPGGVPGAPGG